MTWLRESLGKLAFWWKWLEIFRQWVAKRWFAKGIEAGKAVEKAAASVKVSETEHRTAEKIIKEQKKTIAQHEDRIGKQQVKREKWRRMSQSAEEEEAEWKKRHGF